jgi:hypothetical protein
LALGCNKSILCRFGWLITSHCNNNLAFCPKQVGVG